MVATNIFRELVFSARLFMKKASCGCCVLVFDSSGEPAVHPELWWLLCSGLFPHRVWGWAHHVMRAWCWRHSTCSHGLWVKYELFSFCIRRDLGRFHLCYVQGPREVPTVDFGEGDISTEAETRKQRRSISARISRRLVHLARSASASVDFSGRDHSRTLLKQAFDNGMYDLEWRFL